MQDNFTPIWEYIDKALELLNESSVSAFAYKIKSAAYKNSVKPTILLVGQSTTGKSTLLNLILDEPDFLPMSRVPKAPIPLTVSYGTQLEIKLIPTDPQALPTSISLVDLRQMLLSSTTEQKEYAKVEITSTAELLQHSSFILTQLDPQKSIEAWKLFLSQVDYALLILRAPSLLTEDEKAFIRDVLQPLMGLQRTAVIINQKDVVPKEEHPSLIERLVTFLGPYESEPARFLLSASQLLRRQETGNDLNDPDFNGFKTFLHDDLIGQAGKLSYQTRRQAIKSCLDEIIKATNKQRLINNANYTDMQAVMTRFSQQEQQLHSRIEEVKRDIERAINWIVRDRFFKQAASFRIALSKSLHQEIIAIGTVAEIKRHLPGYLELVWQEFIQNEIPILRKLLIEETEKIAQEVQNELTALLTDTSSDLHQALPSIDLTLPVLRGFMMPERSKGELGNLATTLQFGGLVLLFFANFPLAIASISAGQLIRSLNSWSDTQAEKQAIAQACDETLREMETQLKKVMDAKLSELSETLKTHVAEQYETAVSNIRSLLHEMATEKKQSLAQQQTTETLTETIIPQITRLLDSI